MFTGIVRGVGTITSIEPIHQGVKLALKLTGLDSERVQPGDSIAVNGACLTVKGIANNIAGFDVSSETISKCLVGNWRVGDRVNLEPSLTLQTPVGGHLVSGHIDGTAKLVHRKDNREFSNMRFETEGSIGKFIAVKGSVAIDGISLTTNHVEDCDEKTQFDVMLVPHTLNSTTLKDLRMDSLVHIEIDQIARYIQRICQHK